MPSAAERIRVADYIAQTLAAQGIRHVFMVTGGGAMHLNDAFGRAKGIEVVCCHHEQACAMAAESYFRMTRRLAALNVTTGPGGTNAITGVWGAHVDSVGMIVVSGQVKFETVVRSTPLSLRQLGDQELDITQVVRPFTKYAVMVTDPKEIRYHLERALHLAQTGRPGPTWLDVPMNVQGALVDPGELRGYDPAQDPIEWTTPDLPRSVSRVLDRLARSKRPAVLAGGGVRLSGSYELFLQAIERLGIPVTTAWNAHDLLWDEHPLYCGRPGTVGDRAGNFCVQNSDFLLVLGCRLNIRQISYAWANFARAAYTVMVDADEAELRKPTLRIDRPVHADLGEFLRELLRQLPARARAPSSPRAPIPLAAAPAHASEYLAWCRERVERYPACLPEYWKTSGAVNPYCFVDELTRQLPEGEPIVTGDGTACVVTFQAARLKKGQRLYTNSGCASMGYDLPGAIGACLALGRRRLVCLAGDGSLQMNLQELQTILTQRLPIRVFVLNNQGYHSIRQTQRSYFPDNIVGCGTESGLGFPDLERLAAAYGYPFLRIRGHGEMETKIRETLGGEGPKIAEVMLDLDQQFAPKLASRKLPDGRMVSSPLEDLAPFLPREELRRNMLIPLLEE